MSQGAKAALLFVVCLAVLAFVSDIRHSISSSFALIRGLFAACQRFGRAWLVHVRILGAGRLQSALRVLFLLAHFSWPTLFL